MNSGTHLVSSNTLADVAYHNIRKDIIEEYLPRLIWGSML